MEPTKAGEPGPRPIEAPDREATINRNPHHDFNAVQERRSEYDPARKWTLSKSPNPGWEVGDGASSDHWKGKEFLSIDPWDASRTGVLNYKLLVSTTVPRPIALVSTVAKDGKSRNLAPISYFQNVSTDVSDITFP